MPKAALPLIALAASLAAPPAAMAASDLSVLPLGRYGCWTAGSASGPAVNPQNEFTVVRGSSYLSAAGSGTYLLASDILLFTRGPLKDMRFQRSKDGFWQQVASGGGLGRLKCSRTGAAPMSETAASDQAESITETD